MDLFLYLLQRVEIYMLYINIKLVCKRIEPAFSTDRRRAIFLYIKHFKSQLFQTGAHVSDLMFMYSFFAYVVIGEDNYTSKHQEHNIRMCCVNKNVSDVYVWYCKALINNFINITKLSQTFSQGEQVNILSRLQREFVNMPPCVQNLSYFDERIFRIACPVETAKRDEQPVLRNSGMVDEIMGLQ